MVLCLSFRYHAFNFVYYVSYGVKRNWRVRQCSALSPPLVSAHAHWLPPSIILFTPEMQDGFPDYLRSFGTGYIRPECNFFALKNFWELSVDGEWINIRVVSAITYFNTKIVDPKTEYRAVYLCGVFAAAAAVRRTVLTLTVQMAEPRKVPFVTVSAFSSAAAADPRNPRLEADAEECPGINGRSGGAEMGAGVSCGLSGTDAAGDRGDGGPRRITVRLNLRLSEPSARGSAEFSYAELVQSSEVS